MSEASRQAAVAPSDEHPARWSAKWVYVENSERGAMFDPDQTRWWIKPMGCYADHETRNMVCIMPTGAGKSTFFEAINCWIPAQSPGSSLYATQTDDTAKKWMKTRLRKTLEKCRPLDHLWPSNLRNNATDELINWKNCFLSCGGSGLSNLQEQSITYGQADEVWNWKPFGMVKEWLARSHNRENRKFCMVSQAGVVASEDGIGQTCELHLEHDKCRKWEFGWRCTKCGTCHPFTFEQLQWDTVTRPNGAVDDQLSADTVRRVCPNEECREEYADTVTIRRMLHDSLKENDGYILTSDEGLRGYEGFHVDRGAIWWFSWAYDVLKKLAADRQMALGDHTGLMEWTMKDRALGWSEDRTTEKLELPSSGYTEGDYKPEGEKVRKIESEKLRLMTVDVGSGHWWVAIRAWAEGGDSRLLFFGYIDTIKRLESLPREYGVEPRHVLYDVGWEQEEQAEIIHRNGWQGLKGDGTRMNWDWEIKDGARKGQVEKRLYSHKWTAKAPSGVRAQCWHMATTPLQNILERLIKWQGAKWESYDDKPPSYLKHLNAERLVVDKKKNGHDRRVWTRYGANHGRDCEVMNLCGALMFRVFTPVVRDDAESPAEDAPESDS